ncbi:hypothetical protein L0F63_007319 [Massospora cicadina]|nr:hypothetical protein L0F63_007319 [Massospora cicadina]
MALTESATGFPSAPATEEKFVLELHSHRKLSDVTSVVDRLLVELRGNGYGFFPESLAELAGERDHLLVLQADEGNDRNPQAIESYGMVSLLDQLSGLVALFSGRAASRERVVTFEIRGCRFKIREPSYADSDLGWQTWPAGILLASYISKTEPRVGRPTLELGCGTGLVGVASALWNPGSEHYLTDYHENVLTNVAKTLALNGSPPNVAVHKLDWDWFERDFISWGSDPQLDFWNPFMGTFKIIYAADVLYQLRHASSVPRVIKAFLAPSEKGVHNARTDNDVSKAYVLIPIRSTHLHDTNTFERELTSQGLTVLHTLTFTPPTSSSSDDVFNSIDNPIANDNASPLMKDGYPDISPRDAILAYRLYVCASFSE